MATRQEILNQVTQAFGGVPGWLESFPDSQLEHIWGMLSWVLIDTKLTAQQKALVSFGAAAAIRCPY